MSRTRRTRIVAVVCAGTLAGVLGGTGAAFAGHREAPRAENGPAVACQAVVVAGEQTEGMQFSRLLQTAR